VREVGCWISWMLRARPIVYLFCHVHFIKEASTFDDTACSIVICLLL
jgi:hypothetical protein